MPELNSTLDSVLAFVTIVLVLSLVIQSLQNIIKRLLSMKSKQAEQSLRFLFSYVLNEDKTRDYTGFKYASPVLHSVAALFAREKGVAESLVTAVKKEVLQVGRKSFWGKAVLDSVSKDDLINILKKLQTDPTVKGAIDGKLEEIATWYDTVMPGLAERHERGMKWLAVALSVLIVVLFNANAIDIYRYVASDSAVQKQLVEYGAKLQAESKQAPSAQPGSTPAESLEDRTREDIEKIKTLSSSLANFGLTPLKWDNCFTDAAAIRRTLIGWVAMTLLLSLGAPFWEDALGSLFGLKNTLREKGKEQQKKQQ
jgi:hypothetical protein